MFQYTALRLQVTEDVNEDSELQEKKDSVVSNPRSPSMELSQSSAGDDSSITSPRKSRRRQVSKSAVWHRFCKCQLMLLLTGLYLQGFVKVPVKDRTTARTLALKPFPSYFHVKSFLTMDHPYVRTLPLIFGFHWVRPF